MRNELLVEAKKENLKKVVAFVNEALSAADYSMAKQKQIRLCAEELFMNIAIHAYKGNPGKALIRTRHLQDSSPRQTEISFIDDGPPFDPLSVDSPDMDLSLEDMPIGGLGIHLVKTMADQLNYEYANGRNVVTIRINDPVK